MIDISKKDRKKETETIKKKSCWNGGQREKVTHWKRKKERKNSMIDISKKDRKERKKERKKEQYDISKKDRKKETETI